MKAICSETFAPSSPIPSLESSSVDFAVNGPFSTIDKCVHTESQSGGGGGRQKVALPEKFKGGEERVEHK